MRWQEHGEKSILFITRKWPPAMGGMETYSWELAQRLSKFGPLSTIALPGRANGAVPSAPALMWFGLSTAIRLLFRAPADVIHAGDLAIWPLAWIASLRAPNATVAISLHGSDVNYANGSGIASRLYRAYVRLGVRLLSKAKLISNSEWIAALVREQGYSDVAVVPLATTLRPKTIADHNNGALFFAGRITPSKGLGFLIREVLPLLQPDVRVRVAGSIWDQREAEILTSAQVDFLGVLQPEKLAEEYAQAMCTVVPSLASEGFGLVAAEAASCGGVVIASNHSGLAEVVTPEIGFVADAGNAAIWAEKIGIVANWSKAERAKFIESAMAAAQQKYHWDRVVEETVAAYRLG